MSRILNIVLVEEGWSDETMELALEAAVEAIEKGRLKVDRSWISSPTGRSPHETHEAEPRRAISEDGELDPETVLDIARSAVASLQDIAGDMRRLTSGRPGDQDTVTRPLPPPPVMTPLSATEASRQINQLASGALRLHMDAERNGGTTDVTLAALYAHAIALRALAADMDVPF